MQISRKFREKQTCFVNIFRNIVFMKDKSLQEARQAWLSEEIKKLKKSNPPTEIAGEMGVSISAVSEAINQSRLPSMNFFRKFCETYGHDWQTVNHTLIEQIKQQVSNPEGGGKRVSLPVNAGTETNNPELKSESLTNAKTDEGHKDKSGDNQQDILSSSSTKENAQMNDLIKLALLQQASIDKLIAHAAALEQKIPPATIVSVNRKRIAAEKEK